MIIKYVLLILFIIIFFWAWIVAHEPKYVREYKKMEYDSK